MTLQLKILPRAEEDVQYIYDFLADHSVDGAYRWWGAFDAAINRLAANPEGYSLAPEDATTGYELRQFLFKTRRGRTYRGVFTVVGDELRVLRVRGPGQQPLGADEML